MGKLTVSFVKAVKETGRYSDGNTLLLKVTPGSAKSWIQRLMIHGERRDLGLGAFPFIGLAEARDRAYENRRALAHGGDPLAEKRKARTPLLREAVTKSVRRQQGALATREHGGSLDADDGQARVAGDR